MKKGMIVIVTVIILMIFSSCDYKEKMNDKEIDELVILMKEFVADDGNFTNFFKHSVDNEFLREEDAEKNGGFTKYHSTSNEIDLFFESGTMYTHNKSSNQKTKTPYQFDNILFVANIHYELTRIKQFLKEEYINEVTGSIFSSGSYKTIDIKINSDILSSDGLTSQKYSRITIYAIFDMNDNLNNVGIIYRDMKDNLTYYETGPKLRRKIEFNEDFSKYQ